MSGNNGNSNTSDFDEFVAAGEVEVGSSVAAAANNDGAEDVTPPTKPTRRRAPAAKAAPVQEPERVQNGEEDDGTPGDEDDDTPGDQGGDEDDDDTPGDQGGDEDDAGKPRKKQTASERIRELNRRLRNAERLLAAQQQSPQNQGLPAANVNGNSADEIGEAPDPTDATKYPLGHLDDRYVEDKLEWLANKKAVERADAALQRQQENERNTRLQQEQTVLLGKVDDLADRGSVKFDDFQEVVIDAGMRGDWPLQQATFEAAHEAEHGEQILYALAKDPKEAARVAGLSTFGQAKYVMEKDAELKAKATPRKIPGAGAPPATQSRGANSRVKISPATDNLDDFEKAWEADAK